MTGEEVHLKPPETAKTPKNTPQTRIQPCGTTIKQNTLPFKNILPQKIAKNQVSQKRDISGGCPIPE
jgi:hypothetical protein